MRYRITWVVRGTQTAAALGIDETFRSDEPLEVVRENAEYNAICACVDIEKYDCVVDVIE